MKHIQLALWAFLVLWQYKTITLIDRLRLWRKTLNLYLTFLAFCDKSHLAVQLHGAMLSAFLSALYDYETDWVPIKDESSSLYLAAIKQCVTSPEAARIGVELFRRDLAKQLSEDGLERGSYALEFYRLNIGSEWMKKLSPEEVALYGRDLQMGDDFLDFTEDTEKGHTNCFLTARCDWYVAELRRFLESDFFKTLAENSIAYHWLKKECHQRLNVPEESAPTGRELLRTARAHTGMFAFVLTLVGFKLLDLPWLGAIATGLGFVGATWSIMVLNDLMDRERDTKKNKWVAARFPWSVFILWQRISVLNGAWLLLAGVLSWKAALFCSAVWVLGLLYSVERSSYPLNNLTVAFCSASPVLAGAVYSAEVSVKVWLVFGIVSSTIMVTEIIKDIKDRKDDVGYKDTLAVRSGRIVASFQATALCYVPVTFIVLYPNRIVQATGVCFGLITFWMSMWYTHSDEGKKAERVGDAFLTLLLIALLFS